MCQTRPAPGASGRRWGVSAGDSDEKQASHKEVE